MSGATNVVLNVTEEINGNGSGVGSIHFFNNPRMQMNVGGLITIKRMD